MAGKRNRRRMSGSQQPVAVQCAAGSAVRVNGGDVLECVHRMVLAVERDELRLREQIRSLVQAGRSDEAVRLLLAWDELPAGDVLKRNKIGERAG